MPSWAVETLITSGSAFGEQVNIIRPIDSELLPDGTGHAVYAVEPIAEARLAVSLSFRFMNNDYTSPHDLTDEEFEALCQIRESSLGSAENKDVDEGAAQFFGNFSYPDESPKEIADLIGLEGDDWLLLFEVQSTGDMIWGDAGMLAFLVRQDDLKRGDVTRICACINST